MAESELSITYSDLMAEVADFLGYGVDDDAWTEAQTAQVDRFVQSGVRKFYYPPAMEGVPQGYEWSFMKPVATIDTIDGDGEQDLPDDLGRVLGDFFYESSVYRASIPVVSEAMVLAARSRTSVEGPPTIAAIRHKTQEEGSGQRLEVMWAPVPDTAYTLTYCYEAYSGKLSEDNPYPLGGMKHSECLTESCLAIAEQRANDEAGLHTVAFARALADSVARDQKQGARYYGSMATPSDPRARSRFTEANYPITYKGETW